MEREVVENHERYMQRVKLYRSFGYDIVQERNSILEKSRPITGKILEIGTGKGHFTRVLAAEGHPFISVDLSEEDQRMARLNLLHEGLLDAVELRIENAEALSFDDRQFDMIFSINTMHHLKRPFLVMDEMLRVLKPKGKIVLSDFSPQGFEVIQKILASEGRKHEEITTELEEIFGYLKNKEMNLERHETPFQKIAIVSQTEGKI